MLAVGLLVAGLVAMFVRPVRVPIWAGPLVAVAVLLVSTTAPPGLVLDTMGVLRDPLLFLVFAVPLAVLLDRIGFFSAAAAALDGPVHLHRSLWVLAAGVVVLFNLDAAVVLLTPLYIRIARRRGLDPLVLAFQPAALACLASGVLPVSNLTNLLAAEALHLDVADFLIHLALPSVAATIVGWLAYRRAFLVGAADFGPAVAGGGGGAVERRSLWPGATVTGFVLVGFTVGDRLDVPAWVIAALAVLVLVPLAREVPWRAVPRDAVLLTVCLSVLVAAAAPHLGLAELLARGGTAGQLRAFGFGAVGSLASNNLPAALAGLGALDSEQQVWPMLVGLNIAPILVLSASLSNLLWRDTAARLGVPVSAARFSAMGAAVGLPALLSALAVVLVLGRS